MDDTIRNPYEAYHKELKRQIFEDWFRDTLYSRLEGKRKIIVSATRWATDDVAGRLMEMLEEQHRKYRLITKKAYNPEWLDRRELQEKFGEYGIDTANDIIPVIKDLSEKDVEKSITLLKNPIFNKAMLNPVQLSFEKYYNVLRTIGEDIVEANYNQMPVDLKGCLYQEFLEYDKGEIKSIDNPNGKIEFMQIRARADTADQRR